MKIKDLITQLIYAVVILFLATIQGFASTNIEVSIDEIYVDSTYAATEHVILGLEVALPSNCYTLDRVEFEIHEDRLVELKAFAELKHPDLICTQAIVAVNTEKTLPKLKEGHYTVYSSNTENNFIVQENTLSPNELSTPIFQAQMATEDRNKSVVTIEGEYPHMFTGCMVLNKFQLTASEDQRTIRVVPVAKIVEKCPDDYTYDYSARLEIPSSYEKVKMLRLYQPNMKDLVVFPSKP